MMMKKRFFNFLLIFAAMAYMAVAAVSCQNNGHIGWIFGVWRVEAYTVDGSDAMTPEAAATTFAFQNNIVNVVESLPIAGTSLVRFGTWSEDGSTFVFDFTHRDNDNPQGTGIYAAPEWLGMTSSEPMRMAMTRHGDILRLDYASPEGKAVVYTLKKTSN